MFRLKIAIFLLGLYAVPILAQRPIGGSALILDNNAGKQITIVAPPGLPNSYTWTLPLYPPPPNMAFTEAGSITGQMLRWDQSLGYWTASSRMMIATNGNISIGNNLPSIITLNPGLGGTLVVNNVVTDNTVSQFLMIDEFNHVRTRTLNSILAVNANEGLVYDSPNIKLGATDVVTNPFVTNRFVNLSGQSLTFTNLEGAALLSVNGGLNTVGVGGGLSPMADNVYDLGTNGMRWRDIYVGPNSLHIGNGSGDQTTLSYTNSTTKQFNVDPDDDADIQFSIDETGNVAFTGALSPNSDPGSSGEYLQSNGANTPPTWQSITDAAWGLSGNGGTDSTVHFLGTTDNQDLVFRTNDIPRARFRNATFDEDSGTFEPYINNAYSLGTPTHRWRDLYLGPSSLRIGGFANGTKGAQNPEAVDQVTISYANGTLIIDKPLGSTGSMVPNNTDIFTLGTPTNRWKDLYLGPASLHIGDDTLEAKISYEPSVAELRINTNGSGMSEVVMHGNGDVAILSLAAGGLVKADPVTGILSVANGGSDFESPLTFDNGLVRSGNAIKLGGPLTSSTDVSLNGSNLTFSGTGNVGIGDASPTAAFTVGSGGDFRVDSTGDLIRIRNVSYAWPSGSAAGVLTNDGFGGLSWTAPASAIASLNGETGVTQTFATSTNGSDFSITSSANTHTFNLPDAASDVRGAVTTEAQTFNGNKRFLDSATFETGLALMNQSGIYFNEIWDNGTDGVLLRAPSSVVNPYTLTLPDTDGDSAQVLTTDGAGNLSWTTSGGNAEAAGNDAEVQFNAEGSLSSSTNFTYNGTTLTVVSTGSAVSDTTSSTTDEEFAMRGTATGVTAVQVIGIWGDASAADSANTGTIGVLATGNGNTAATETNVAAQINDGEFTMGRTTETTALSCSIGGSSIALAEDATGGSAYSAEGPSGVVEVTNLSIAVSNAQVEPAGILTIPNRYVNASSIILVTVYDATAAAGANEFSFSTQVRGRDDDSFDVTVNVIKSGATARTLTGYKVGYMVLNPSR